MKAIFFTRDSIFVEDALMLPVGLPPVIIIRGTRYFVRNIFMDTKAYYGYVEATAWVSVELPPCHV